MPARQGESLAQYDAGIRRVVAVDISSTDQALTSVTRGLYVGVSGDVAVIFADDADAGGVTLNNLAAGVWHPIQIRSVIKIGTTATGIKAGY